MKPVKMTAVFLAALLLLSGIAAAENDWFFLHTQIYSEQSVSAALTAALPEGEAFTDREADIYRLGFAAGYDQASVPVRGVISTYVLNVNTMKFHLPECSSVKEIKEKNRRDYTGSRDVLIDVGYQPCKNCNP